MQSLRVMRHGFTLSMLCGATLLGAACASDPAAGDASSPAGSPAVTTRVPARLARALTGQVGYHALGPEPAQDWGSALEWQVPPIVTGGGTPVAILDPSAAALASLDVLWVDSWFYSPMRSYVEWMARQPDLDAAVQNGMVLVVHDDGVPWDGTPLPLPGAGDLAATRESWVPGTMADINIRDGSTQVTSGLTDSSLDLHGEDLPPETGGFVSPVSYVNASLLPSNAKLILSRPEPDEIVTFCYPHGKGAVIYSTIWLSEWTGDLEGGDYYPAELQNAMTKIYAPNVVRYALAGACKE